MVAALCGGVIVFIIIPMLKYWVIQIQDMEKRLRELEDVVKKVI